MIQGGAAGSLPEGITVRGTGTADAPADQATLNLRVFGRNNASVITEATLEPVIDALVKAGVSRTDITTPAYLTAGAQVSNATVTAVVHHPTVTMLQDGVGAMVAVFPPNSQTVLSSADVRLTANDCSATRAQAQAAAIRQARSNAQSIAHSLGVRIGQVLAVDYQTGPLDPGGACFYTYNLGPYQNSLFQSAADYLRVRVSSSVEIRYAIK